MLQVIEEKQETLDKENKKAVGILRIRAAVMSREKSMERWKIWCKKEDSLVPYLKMKIYSMRLDSFFYLQLKIFKTKLPEIVF